MANQLENFNYAFPNCLAFEFFFDGHTFKVLGFHPMQMFDRVL